MIGTHSFRKEITSFLSGTRHSHVSFQIPRNGVHRVRYGRYRIYVGKYVKAWVIEINEEGCLFAIS